MLLSQLLSWRSAAQVGGGKTSLGPALGLPWFCAIGSGYTIGQQPANGPGCFCDDPLERGAGGGARLGAERAGSVGEALPHLLVSLVRVGPSTHPDI